METRTIGKKHVSITPVNNADNTYNTDNINNIYKTYDIYNFDEIDNLCDTYIALGDLLKTP